MTKKKRYRDQLTSAMAQKNRTAVQDFVRKRKKYLFLGYFLIQCGQLVLD